MSRVRCTRCGRATRLTGKWWLKRRFTIAVGVVRQRICFGCRHVQREALSPGAGQEGGK